ncbi:MAG: aquaporin, partial [Planctomycetota bacterium]
GCGSIVLTRALGDIDPMAATVAVALAFASVLTVFVTATMYISGAHFNPAVSVAFALIGRLKPIDLAVYVVLQLLAACCAVGMIVLCLSGHPVLAAAIDAANHGASLGILSVGQDASPMAVLGLEALMTFALMFVILWGVADRHAHKLGGLCVGLVVAACVLSFGPITGASLNPARSLGPAIYGYWDMHWVYWLGPTAGACAAALVYRLAFEERE